jgi:ParB-like chromosome segregation protein Spo0J
LDFKKLRISELKPAAYNPRKDLKSGDPEFEKIKNSIIEFGYVEPIIVNSDFSVVGGHQRIKVLKELGYDEIDCVVIDMTVCQVKCDSSCKNN